MATEAETPADIDEATAKKAANRFDIRRIIGGVFLLYGLILTVVGIFGSEAVKNRGAGVNGTLWPARGMRAVGWLMAAGALTRRAEPPARRWPPGAARPPAQARRRVERGERRAVG